jgi:Bacterial regulatory proteins, luxR family
LTAREREVMVLVTAGLMNTDAELGVSEITVKIHRGHTMKKMGARSLADLVRNGRSPGDSTGATISTRKPKYDFPRLLVHQISPVGILPMQTARCFSRAEDRHFVSSTGDRDR